MRITSLASGSLGNSLLVEAGGVRLLVDAGLAANELERRLEAVDVRPRAVDYLFVTHRHGDHVRGATDFARRHRVRIRTTRRTARALGTEVYRRLVRVEFERPFEVGGLVLRAIRLPHDAPETAGLVVESGGLRFGYATDLGCVDDGIADALGRCDALFLESNHDVAMVERGADPPFLKRRITSNTGHLSNDQAADLLSRLAGPRLQHVWLGHLSRRNNRPELALASARSALTAFPAARIQVASQDEPAAPIEVHPIANPAE